MPRYALLQRSLDPLPVKRLAAAFSASGVRVPLDAPAVARAAFGVLLDDLTATAASRLTAALALEGIETEAVEESALPALPRRRLVRRAEATAEGLLWSTAVGKPRVLPWQAVRVAAMGAVRRRPRHVVRQVIPGLDEALETSEPEDPTQVEDLALELLSDIEPGRLRIVADDCAYDSLGARMRPRARENFPILARSILERCDVMPNRGAARFHLGHPEWLSYPTWTAFEEETRWLLWKLSWRAARSGRLDAVAPSEPKRRKR